ncbi:MAG: NAD(P)-dependent oxidoreductase [Burkholderiaceae bacterium]|nr:NAD(P)-dependent oxidoreductase [Burkholderiaceae bacterium]
MAGETTQLGFIGLGVMGEPMCRNLVQKSGARVMAHDRDPAPLERLRAHGAQACAQLREAVEGSSVIFLSLPSGEVVRELALAEGGLLDCASKGQIVVDTSTSPVGSTRELAERFGERGVTFIDAPIARTRAAAEAGALSVMVGADPAVFEQVRGYIATFATDISLCGPVGCGQVVKIMNNMVLFETVMALSEAKTIGERAGVPAELLFEVLSKGSADSFALRNHGMKAIVPDEFPLRAFSTIYARKDLRYARELAAQTGVDARGADTVDGWFDAAIEAGDGDNYFPVIARRLAATPRGSQ